MPTANISDMDRVYNFSAAQTMLPPEVLSGLSANLFSYEGTGISPLELDYTGDTCHKIAAEAEESLRTLLGVPSNYRILFMQGGASTQFSAIPLNLLSAHTCADYLITGVFSRQAYLEGKRYGDMAIAATSAGASPAFSSVPETQKSDFRPDADYVHLCYNNTVYGTRFHTVPDTGNIPLVADMSSCFLSEPIDTPSFGMIYASAQKNIGVAGLTVVILRDDLIGHARSDTPAPLDYRAVAEGDPYPAAPVAFPLYMASRVFSWMLSVGGLDEMKRRNERKASLLYDYLDSQTYYTAQVNKKYRSMTNVVFLTGNAACDAEFVRQAAEAGLVGLAGHHTVGGLRASVYNAMPYEGVERLVDFMRRFAMENPKIEL